MEILIELWDVHFLQGIFHIPKIIHKVDFLQLHVRQTSRGIKNLSDNIPHFFIVESCKHHSAFEPQWQEFLDVKKQQQIFKIFSFL